MWKNKVLSQVFLSFLYLPFVGRKKGKRNITNRSKKASLVEHLTRRKHRVFFVLVACCYVACVVIKLFLNENTLCSIFKPVK